ncbi:uncharacterized protein LOC136025615 [Artemia franciscana]|uniref:uncharacterized protein LOC136025615 n=1 Tax=Artemia franciscana TaxID=6661 RepID=UPI0032DA5A11
MALCMYKKYINLLLYNYTMTQSLFFIVQISILLIVQISVVTGGKCLDQCSRRDHTTDEHCARISGVAGMPFNFKGSPFNVNVKDTRYTPILDAFQSYIKTTKIYNMTFEQERPKFYTVSVNQFYTYGRGSMILQLSVSEKQESEIITIEHEIWQSEEMNEAKGYTIFEEDIQTLENRLNARYKINEFKGKKKDLLSFKNCRVMLSRSAMTLFTLITIKYKLNKYDYISSALIPGVVFTEIDSFFKEDMPEECGKQWREHFRNMYMKTNGGNTRLLEPHRAFVTLEHKDDNFFLLFNCPQFCTHLVMEPNQERRVGSYDWPQERLEFSLAVNAEHEGINFLFKTDIEGTSIEVILYRDGFVVISTDGNGIEKHGGKNKFSRPLPPGCLAKVKSERNKEFQRGNGLSYYCLFTFEVDIDDYVKVTVKSYKRQELSGELKLKKPLQANGIKEVYLHGTGYKSKATQTEDQKRKLIIYAINGKNERPCNPLIRNDHGVINVERSHIYATEAFLPPQKRANEFSFPRRLKIKKDFGNVTSRSFIPTVNYNHRGNIYTTHRWDSQKFNQTNFRRREYGDETSSGSAIKRNIFLPVVLFCVFLQILT